MWSRNSYLIPPSHHPRATTSAFDLGGVEVLLHQHHHHHRHHPDAFSGVYLAADSAAMFNNGGLSGEPSSAAVQQPKQATAAKKDRHSKIHTAQGPRDRRVRLSIGIARKFFDLQEMLGFDKPSKTLDWLLTKSKEAIQELLEQTKRKASGSGKSGSSPSECELLDFENGSAADDSRRECRAAAGKEPQLLQASSLVRESRAKARARARERTLEKMCIKQLGGARTNGSELNPSSSSFECRNINELEFLQLSAAGNYNSNYSVKTTTTSSAGFPHLPLSNDDLIEESILIKRKSKNPSSHLGFQQNLVFSRDLNSNYINIPSANNASENWDVFGLTSQSNLHAILDQHRFINRKQLLEFTQD